MAVVGVTKVREFEFNDITLTASEIYNIFYDDNGDNYTTKAQQAVVAVDPVTLVTPTTAIFLNP